MLLFEILAMIIVWQSALLLIVKGVFTLILLLVLFSIYRAPKPEAKYLQLSYLGGVWWLMDVDGLEQKYQTAEITFNAGLFFLLVLKGEKFKRRLVVFNDQITQADFRFIKHVSLRVGERR